MHIFINTKHIYVCIQRALLECGQRLTSAMANLTAAARGFDSKQVDEAIQQVLAQANRLMMLPPPLSKNIQTCTEELANCSKALSAAVSQVR